MSAYYRKKRYRRGNKILRAKRAARSKSRQVYRTNVRKPKRQVVKKFSNFVGKVTFKKVASKRR